MPIVIDPYLIAVPAMDNTDAERVRTYAKSLSCWEKEFVASAEDYFVSLAAFQVIQQNGLMPTMSSLQQLFDRYGIEEYSARDIVPDCSNYLANCLYLEEVSGVFEIYDEVEQIQGTDSIIPEEMRSRLEPSVADSFIGSLIYAAYALEADPSTTGWSIATAPLNSAFPEANLHTSAGLRKIADVTGDIVEAKIERSWPLLIEPDYLYATLEVTEYVQDLLMASRITWCKLKANGSRVSEVDWSAVRFGSRFTGSLNEPKIHRRPTVKRDIEEVFFMVVEVLQGLPFGSDKHHALRNPVYMRSAPVQTRQVRTSDGVLKNDEAARVEVTSGAAPLRLHYWRCHDGSYEFSNVTCDHNDPTIYAN
jgi:hypothetical protein